jgi:uncharacterized protein YbjT (DUF2867 family)
MAVERMTIFGASGFLGRYIVRRLPATVRSSPPLSAIRMGHVF